MYLLLLTFLWTNSVAFHLETRHFADIPGKVALPVRKTTTERDKDCLDGWEGGTSYCYKVVREYSTWSNAQAACLKIGGKLAAPKTAAESKDLKRIVNNTGRMWIAGTYNFDTEKFYWGFENPPEEIKITNWNTRTNEPRFDASYTYKNSGGYCIALRSPHSKWRLFPCARDLHYVCQKDKEVCPDEWIEETSYCYIVVDKEYKWSDAKADCENLKGKLVSPKTSPEMKDIQKILRRFKYKSAWTAGRYDFLTEKFYWSFDIPPEEIQNTYWNDDEPYFYGYDYEKTHGGFCISTSSPNYKWAVESCGGPRKYMCQKDKTKTSQKPRCSGGWMEGITYCYIHIDTPSTWDDARASCQFSFGGLLASPKTAEENEDVAKVVKEYGQTSWIGGSYTPTTKKFYWVPGDFPAKLKIQYWNWVPDTDSLLKYGGRYCIAFAEQYNGKADAYKYGWTQRTCDSGYGYICQKDKARCSENGDGWMNGTLYCYIYVWGHFSWGNARVDCQTGYGGILASPNTIKENEDIATLLKNITSTRTIYFTWIGGSLDPDTEEFYWAAGGVPEEIKREDLSPQGSSVDEIKWNLECIGVSPSFYWRVTQCNYDNFGYVCQKDKSTEALSSTSTVPTSSTTEPSVTTITKSNCPNGWIEGTSYCYNYIDKLASWKDARTDCQTSYAGILASPNTAAENADITKLAKNSAAQFPWLGGKYVHKTKKFYWSAGDSPEELQFSNWQSEPPKDGLGRWSRFCIALRSTDGYKWFYMGCNADSDYICQIDKGTKLPSFTSSTHQPASSTATGLTCPEKDWVEGRSYCYTYVGYEVSWEEARVDCQTTYGGMLASPRTAMENEDIAKLMKNISKSVWFGGSYNLKHQQFYWSAGDYPDEIQFQNWHSTVDPNNPTSFIKDDSHCIAGMPDKYEWGYFSCPHESFGYVCQREKGNSLQSTFPSLQCPPGWIAEFGWCYYFSDYEMNWHNAQTKCESFGGNLAEPAFEYSIQMVTENAKSLKQSFWIGGTDEGNEGKWVWSTMSKLISIFTNWGQNQPNNAFWNEHCLKISKESDYKWEDDNCFHEFRFICQSKKMHLEVTSTIEPVNVTSVPAANCRTEPGYVRTENHCYFFSNTSLDWGQAEKSCNAKGGKLVEPKTKEAKEFVREKAKDRLENFWIGGIKHDSQWTWASNTEKIDIFDWSIGEPNSKEGNENCIRVLQWLEYHWSDQNCHTKSRFICEI